MNLYPFEATVAREGVTWAEAIEQIDIGGPSLVRAAAKNHAFVTLATSPEQYAEILEQIQQSGGTQPELRRRLASAAFARTAAYDQAISEFFLQQEQSAEQGFPERTNLSLHRRSVLRYGENPHQKAAVYSAGTFPGPSLISARQLNGKELSYNNLLDLDSALCIARSLPDAAAVVIKHNNPCGAASAKTLADATRKALDGDPVSAFGSILGFNQVVDAATRGSARDARPVHRSRRCARLRAGGVGDSDHPSQVAKQCAVDGSRIRWIRPSAARSTGRLRADCWYRTPML